MKNIPLAALLLTLAACAESVPAGRTLPSAGQPAFSGPNDPTAVGYLNLERRHPDAVDGIEEFNSYSADRGLQDLARMRGFLDSFGQLTELARKRLADAELRSVDNTSPAMQTIGFHNIPLGVEATILKQDYQLRQAEYELAHSNGRVTTRAWRMWTGRGAPTRRLRSGSRVSGTTSGRPTRRHQPPPSVFEPRTHPRRPPAPQQRQPRWHAMPLTIHESCRHEYSVSASPRGVGH